MTTLTPTQRTTLETATSRKDRIIALPAHLEGTAFNKIGQRLIALGLAEETAASGRMPVWRQAGTAAYALKITPAGLSALGLTPAATETTDGLARPRPGTKLALVIERLRRPDGVTIGDLVALTGWLPHTTRAVLTGLRKRGLVIERSRHETGGSVYRIAI